MISVLIRRLRSARKGAGLVEYGILVGLIAILAIAAVLGTGTQVRSVFCTVTDELRFTLFGEERVCESTTVADGSGGITVPAGPTFASGGQFVAQFSGGGSVTVNYQTSGDPLQIDINNDGSIEHNYITASGTRTFALPPGRVEVSFNVSSPGLVLSFSTSTMLSVENWGDNIVQAGSFFGYSALASPDYIAPLPEQLTILSETFAGVDMSNVTGLSAWNTSRVEQMQYLFWGSNFAGFSDDITGWDTSAVWNYRSMFDSSTFDQDISGWNVSGENATTNTTNRLYNEMFENNTAFGVSGAYDLSGWCSSLGELAQNTNNFAAGSTASAASALNGSGFLDTCP